MAKLKLGFFLVLLLDMVLLTILVLGGQQIGPSANPVAILPPASELTSRAWQALAKETGYTDFQIDPFWIIDKDERVWLAVTLSRGQSKELWLLRADWDDTGEVIGMTVVQRVR